MFLHRISYWIGDLTCFFPSPFIFRVLVEQLEKVKLSQLDGDAQIAFWINVHNALVMHVINNDFYLKIFQAYVILFWKSACITLISCCQAYLAYGIPQGSLRRLALFHKVAHFFFVIRMNGNCIFFAIHSVDIFI